MSKQVTKVMHDSDARNDPKLRALRRFDDDRSLGKWWCLVEIMRNQRDAKLDTHTPGFTEWMCEELRLDEAGVAKFFEVLSSDRIQLLKTDGRYYWSVRLSDDYSRFQRRCEINAQNGARGGSSKTSPPPDSERLANAKQSPSGRLAFHLLSLLSRSNLDFKTITKEDLSSLSISPDEWKQTRALIKEFSLPCVRHYVTICSKHLSAKGEVPVSFLDYTEKWIRKDSVVRDGWFKLNFQSQSKRPDRVLFTAKEKFDAPSQAPQSPAKSGSPRAMSSAAETVNSIIRKVS